jgi:DNA-binding NarL/FixJ family response regulator
VYLSIYRPIIELKLVLPTHGCSREIAGRNGQKLPVHRATTLESSSPLPNRTTPLGNLSNPAVCHSVGIMQKRRLIRKLDVCLLTPHPLAGRAVKALLPQNGFTLNVVQLGSTDPISDLRSVPAAAVYLIDAYTCPQYAADVATGLLEIDSNARMIALGEAFCESETLPLLHSGARGLLSHTDLCEHLKQAITEVAAGRFWVPRPLMSHALEIMLDGARDSHVQVNDGCTPREQQVLEAVLENLGNKEIAAKLHMAERTAKFYVSKLLARYGVRRRGDLILLHFQRTAKNHRSLYPPQQNPTAT